MEEAGVRVTPQVLCDAYNKDVKVAENSDNVTSSFCDMASTVWDRALSLPKVKVCVQQEDEKRHRSLFNSPYVMQEIINKAKTAQDIEWTFLHLAMQEASGQLDRDLMTMKALQGRSKNAAGASTIDVIVTKRKLGHFILTEWARRNAMNPAGIDKIKQFAEDPQIWHNFQGTSASPVDSATRALKGGWSEDLHLLTEFLDELVFGLTYDELVRIAVKHKATPEDALEYPDLKSN